MKYKVGDRVRIKNLDWYNENKDKDGFVHCGDKVFDNYMSVFCGSIVNIDGDYICISKEELEKWREHYQEEANTRGRGKIGWFYLGKREVIVDMLKMFEPLDG